MKETKDKSVATSTTGCNAQVLGPVLAKHFGGALGRQSTDNVVATRTQTLAMQVDIGLAATPFNLDAIEEGKMRKER